MKHGITLTTFVTGFISVGLLSVGIASAGLLSTVLSSSAMAQVQEAAAWDGVSKSAQDDIVTLRLPSAPREILLNGDPAIVHAQSPTLIKVLIRADSSGISCQNVYTVKFAGEKNGQLIANHCHGDTIFDVRPGELAQSTVTKEDVDNPDDDIRSNDDAPDDSESEAQPIRWNDDRFVTIERDLKWMSGGAPEPYLMFSIPETDAFYWIAGCKNGRITNYIQSVNGDETIGDKVSIFFGTDKESPIRYGAKIAALPFGDGDGNSPTIILSLPVQNQLFDNMIAGNWLYVITGLDENQIRRRMSLSGSAKAIRTFQAGCARSVSSAAPSLNAYIGKYQFEEIAGYSLLNHPQFRNNVNAVVNNDIDRKWLFNENATSGPIEFRDGKIIAWACEQHNCGNRNWNVAIDLQSQETEVCFHLLQGGLERNVRYTANGMITLPPGETCAL